MIICLVAILASKIILLKELTPGCSPSDNMPYGDFGKPLVKGFQCSLDGDMPCGNLARVSLVKGLTP